MIRRNLRHLRGLAWICCTCAAAAYAEAPLRGREAIEALKQQGVYESLRTAYGAVRYQVERIAQTGFHRASNQAQGIEVEFGQDEIRLSRRLHRLDMRLVGYGYGGRWRKPTAARVTAQGNCVEYRRDGLKEWYVNAARGLEQGFTLEQRPGHARAGEALVVVLETRGDLRPVAEAGGERIGLVVGEEAMLRYSGLNTWDARGRSVPSRLQVVGRQIRILVEDVAAEYPLTVDPLFTEPTKLTASDGAATDWFGYSVALYGDTALVGAPYADIGGVANQGSAYVFVRSGGTWSQQQKLTASDGEAEWFGYSVALYGDTALVGAPYADIGGVANQGSAYVFVRSGGAWTQQQRLTASDGAANDQFGYSVALSGDTALVGAPLADVDTNTNQGSAYVFVRSGGTWSRQQKLTASDGATGDCFGYSVALSGDTVLVGAFWDEVGANNNQGSAYVFVRSGGAWTQQQQLTASDGAANDQFGYSVALSGDTALVGAYWHKVGANTDQGSVYVFVRRVGTWTQQQKLTASDGAAGDRFGGSVALSGDVALVGAYLDTIGKNTQQGSAYVFVRNGETWSQHQKLTASDGAQIDWFGWSVALSGDTALLGAIRRNVGDNNDQGSLYVFFAPAIPVFTNLSAASVLPDAPVAPDSIAAGFGEGLAATTEIAPSTLPLPTSLAGTSVKVTDSTGSERPAPLWFVSPTQINYYIPAETAVGLATVTVARNSQTVASGTLQVEGVAPGLFAMNANGQGVPAALAILAKGDGSQTWQYVFNPGCQVGSCQPVPVDLGAATDQVFLQLYGTGIRGRSSLAAVTAKIGGADAPVEYAGLVEGTVGLDQVNLRVPRSLIGRGEVDVVLTVDGKTANTVTVNIK